MLINGKEVELEIGISIEQMLETLNLPKEKIVVELNLEIVEISKYSSTFLNEGDQMEIVTFVGGG